MSFDISADEEFAADLALICGRLQRLAKRMAGIPPSSSTWHALHIIETFGPLNTGSFSRWDGQSPSSTTRLVERLENEGLIRREPDPADGRVQVLTLTDEGRQHCRMLERKLGHALWPVLADLPPAELHQIQQLLPTLAELVDKLRNHTADEEVK